MAIDNLKTSKVSVGDTATPIITTNPNRKDTIIYNNGGQTVYIDNISGECTVDSFPIPSGANLELGNYQGAIYGIVSSGTCEVRIIYREY